jgi:hypothetical protein
MNRQVTTAEVARPELTITTMPTKMTRHSVADALLADQSRHKAMAVPRP